MLAFYSTRALADAAAVLAWMKGEITREAMLDRIACEEADVLPHDADVHRAEAIIHAASLYRTLRPKDAPSVVETDPSRFEARPWIGLDLLDVERERDDSDDWADPVRVEDVTWDDDLYVGRRFVAQAIGRAKAVRAKMDEIVQDKVTELFARGLSHPRAARDPEGWMRWANVQAHKTAGDWGNPILVSLREEVRWAIAIIGPEVLPESMPLVGEKFLATYKAEVAALRSDDREAERAVEYIVGRDEMETSTTQALARAAWYDAKLEERRRELHREFSEWFGTAKYGEKSLVLSWTQNPEGQWVPGDRQTPREFVASRVARFGGDELKGVASALQTVRAKNRRRAEQRAKVAAATSVSETRIAS